MLIILKIVNVTYFYIGKTRSFLRVFHGACLSAEASTG